SLADALAAVLHQKHVSVDSHFFDDLGADSLLMAQFCARVRKAADVSSVSIRDVYTHPTIRSLATALDEKVPDPVGSVVIPATLAIPARTATAQYLLCGFSQLVLLLGALFLSALLITKGCEWATASEANLIETYLRAVLFGSLALVASCALPIVAKWVLVGRWKPQEFSVWSGAYIRFWLVKTLIRANPMAFFVGSPLYLVYLRALGAKIGRGVAIFSRTVPVCTDLLTIGDGTVIRKDTSFVCYRVQAGRIQTGSVTLGRNVVVAEQSVLDIETSMGDRAQLGHASSLHALQTVPEDESWHGSPAQRCSVDYRSVGPTRCSTLRRILFSVWQLVNLLGITVPLAIMAGKISINFGELGTLPLTSWMSYVELLMVSLALFFGTVLVGLVMVILLPRLLHLLITPDRIYPLYGLHYSIHRTITRITNTRFYMTLFGDSSYIVRYLQTLGYRLSPVEQTGSNFGLSQRHETPYLCTIGCGTMVSDGLSVINANFSSASFTVTPVAIGARSFLGNNILYPSTNRMGDDCLYGTKAMVPIDGKIREGVGLLGSPSFEIPRSVHRDHSFDYLRSGEELRRRLAGKNRHNIVTMGILLVVRWLHFFAVTVLAVFAAALYDRIGATATAMYVIGTALFSIAYFILVERAVSGFRSMKPQFCSIYHPYYWWHERFWKLSASILGVLNGTPFKNVAWRLLGVGIGRRVFDDGCGIVEKTLVTVGDDCTLSAGSSLQSHSLEEGTFKSNYITLGAGCTIGTSAFIHYGVTIGDGAVIDPDAFLMKGTKVAPGTRWRGNPAHEIPGAAAVTPTQGATPAPAVPIPAGAATMSAAGSPREQPEATTSVAVRTTATRPPDRPFRTYEAPTRELATPAPHPEPR
ncbi:MAG: peptide synthetase, partial [Pseudonocardiales bacterium]|nr:peptide synthetase [Pseudonocardiales bacterium]